MKRGGFIKLHPLFLAVFAVSAYFGGVAKMLFYLLAAVLHEFGHGLFALRRGAKLNNITLLPCGAVINLEKKLFSKSDEIKLAAAGPAVNFILAVFCIALFWIYPVLSGFFDEFFKANLVLGTINLLPFFPLDGSIIAVALFAEKKGRKKVISVISAAGIAASFVIFFFGIFFMNITVAVFALLIVSGTFSAEENYCYERARNLLSFENGQDVNLKAFCSDTTLLTLVKNMNYRKLNVFVIADCGNKVLTDGDILNLCEEYPLDRKLKDTGFNKNA